MFTAFGVWPRSAFKSTGTFSTWEGRSFCPECGSTVHYSGGNFPDVIAIPLGALDDPNIVDSPDYSVWERRKHDWLEIIDEDVGLRHVRGCGRPQPAAVDERIHVVQRACRAAAPRGPRP